MRRFVLGWKRMGLEQRLGAQIVNYADELVRCCRHGADEALAVMRGLMGRLKLTVNEEKTRTCHVPQETFDFLGYTFGRCYSAKTGRAYLGTRPSKKSIRRLIYWIGEHPDRRTCQLEATHQVERVNRKLTGWANYFCLGPVSQAYRAIDAYTSARLRRGLCGKHQRAGRGFQRYPDSDLYEHLGLVRLAPRTQSLPWAKP
jgi:hypothetical protein